MKRGAKILITIWIIIAVVIVGLIFVGARWSPWNYYSRSSNNRSGFSTTYLTSSSDTKELLLDETVSISGINTIKLDFFSESVDIYSSETNDMRVVHYGRNLPSNMEIEVKTTADTITVTRVQQRGIQNWFGVNSASWVEIYLPQSYTQELDLEISSGNVNVNTSLNLTELDVEVFSGNVKFNDPIQATEADLNLSSGNLTIQQLYTDSFSMESFSGTLKIGDLSGSGSIELSSGKTTIDRWEPGDSLKTEVFSGTLNVGITGERGIDFKGEKFSGNLDVWFELYSKDGDRSNVQGTWGEEPYVRITSSVSSGTTRFTQA